MGLYETASSYQLSNRSGQLDGRFAIRQRTFATANLNGRFGSTPAVRDRLISARNGHSLGPRARFACGSESGRSDDALQTAGFDPERPSRAIRSKPFLLMSIPINVTLSVALRAIVHAPSVICTQSQRVRLGARSVHPISGLCQGPGGAMEIACRRNPLKRRELHTTRATIRSRPRSAVLKEV